MKKNRELKLFMSILEKNFEDKKKKNPKYSQRAYAKYLGLPPSTLNEIIRGKLTGHNKDIVNKIGKKIGLTDEEVKYFSLFFERERVKVVAKKNDLYQQAIKLNVRHNTISDEEFALVGKWYCFAVMELIKLQGSSLDPEWIAKRLSISPIEALGSLHALQKLGIIKINKEGKLTILKDFIAIPSGKPLPGTATYHEEVLKKSLVALKEQPKGTRNFSSLIMRFKKKDIEEVDNFLKKVRREFSDRFEDGQDHDSVYALNIQFIRLDQEIP